jgi:Fic family protein
MKDQIERLVDSAKVPAMLSEFCKELNYKFNHVENKMDALITSFDAHFNLVSIHPFADGNGRVARLLMNYIQNRFELPLSNVYKEDKADYYKALTDSRKNENLDIFRSFMLGQYEKLLEVEINKHLESQNEHIIKKENSKEFGMSMFF